jgi:uncharacterized peroxidase-related enzyme
MSRLQAIRTQSATGKAKELLDFVQAKFRSTPNMARVMANSPAVLQAYLSFESALAAGVLHPQLREEIALAVSEQNSCQYCVSAHTAIAKKTGLSEKEIEQARDANSDSLKHAAALSFARAVVAKRGQPTDADFELVKRVGFSDGEIAEIIAHIALNIFTNYFNNSTQPEVDFPMVELHRAA